MYIKSRRGLCDDISPIPILKHSDPMTDCQAVGSPFYMRPVQSKHFQNGDDNERCGSKMGDWENGKENSNGKKIEMKNQRHIATRTSFMLQAMGRPTPLSCTARTSDLIYLYICFLIKFTKLRLNLN